MHTADIAHKLGNVKEALEAHLKNFVAQQLLSNDELFYYNNLFSDWDQSWLGLYLACKKLSSIDKGPHFRNKAKPNSSEDMYPADILPCLKDEYNLNRIMQDRIHPFDEELFKQLETDWELTRDELIATYKKFNGCDCPAQPKIQYPPQNPSGGKRIKSIFNFLYLGPLSRSSRPLNYFSSLQRRLFRLTNTITQSLTRLTTDWFSKQRSKK